MILIIDLEDAHLLAGTKQVCRAVKLGNIKLVVLASDVDEYIRKKINEECTQVEIVDGPTMLELGKLCGIKIGTAVVGVLND